MPTALDNSQRIPFAGRLATVLAFVAFLSACGGGTPISNRTPDQVASCLNGAGADIVSQDQSNMDS